MLHCLAFMAEGWNSRDWHERRHRGTHDRMRGKGQWLCLARFWGWHLAFQAGLSSDCFPNPNVTFPWANFFSAILNWNGTLTSVLIEIKASSLKLVSFLLWIVDYNLNFYFEISISSSKKYQGRFMKKILRNIGGSRITFCREKYKWRGEHVNAMWVDIYSCCD